MMFGSIHSPKPQPPGSHVVCGLKQIYIGHAAIRATIVIIYDYDTDRFEYFRTGRSNWEHKYLIKFSYTDRHGKSKLVSLFG